MPPLLHCRKCSTEVLYTNATFFMLAGKEWTVAVPHCPQCDLNEETIKGIPYGRQAIGFESRSSNRPCGAKDKEKLQALMSGRDR
jgi:hypothetical protein